MFPKKLFKDIPREQLIMGALFIILLNVILKDVAHDIEHTYNFNSDQIDTILYIHQRVPKNYMLILPDLGEKNYLYDLLVGYDYKLYDNAKRGLYDKVRGFLTTYNERYAVIDLTLINPMDYEEFLNDEEFIIIYSNSQNIIFWYNY